MSKKFDLPTGDKVELRQQKSSGPMQLAIQETGVAMTSSEKDLKAQRRENSEFAKKYVFAKDSGLLLERINLSDVRTNELTRDRTAGQSIESSPDFEELVYSIRKYGQRTPVELYRDSDGELQLQSGYRRLMAISKLQRETGEDAFDTILAQVVSTSKSSASRYIAMVEENLIRSDVSYAELAQLAIHCAQNEDGFDDDPRNVVETLYGSLNRPKRAHLKNFIDLLLPLGESLKWQEAISRNVGLELVKPIIDGHDVASLKRELSRCSDQQQQAEIINDYLKSNVSNDNLRDQTANQKNKKKQQSTKPPSTSKLQLKMGDIRLTARDGELRVVANLDFTAIDQDTLQNEINDLVMRLTR